MADPAFGLATPTALAFTLLARAAVRVLATLAICLLDSILFSVLVVEVVCIVAVPSRSCLYVVGISLRSMLSRILSAVGPNGHRLGLGLGLRLRLGLRVN